MGVAEPAEWTKWRSKSDSSVVYTARLTKAGDYLVRGGGAASMGQRGTRVPKAAFERLYERITDG